MISKIFGLTELTASCKVNISNSLNKMSSEKEVAHDNVSTNKKKIKSVVYKCEVIKKKVER